MERNDFDRISLESITVGSTDITGSCEPFAEEGTHILKLYNNGGFFICSLDKSYYEDEKSAYTTPMSIKLSYSYRSTISKPIEILKLTGSTN